MMKTTGNRIPRTSGLLLWLAIPGLVLSGCGNRPPETPTPSPSANISQSAAPSATPTPETSVAPSGTPSATAPESGAPTSGPASATSQAPGSAQALLAGMDLEEKVGQVLMAGFPATGSSAQDRRNIADHSIGNVFLKGRSSAGTGATGAIVDRVKTTIAQSQSVDVAPWVATDQEGGLVQVLKGPGFAKIPSGKVQGTWSAGTLKENATTWGQELAAAGINVNLAPVADTVPGASFAPSNAPIGFFGRQYGYTPAAVAAGSGAFSDGMKAAGVEPVVKHFPGLGRVTKNTDVAKNVTDTQTTRNDPYLEPFRDAIDEGNRWVMVSNAYYSKIDPRNIAPFSDTIMRGMLRQDLGFTGIVISDDMCDAVQLSPWSLGARAINFFEAGGTMLLCVESSKTATMAQALQSKASQDPAFAQLIDEAALRVLETKVKD